MKNEPWLSIEILKMIKIRNKIFAWKKRQPNNENCKRLYNLLTNRVNRELKKSPPPPPPQKNTILITSPKMLITLKKTGKELRKLLI